MSLYKEVVKLDKITHNGVDYIKGQTVREKVNLSDVHVKALNADPSITGCEYIPLEAKPEDKKAIRESLKARAEALELTYPKNISNEDLEALIVAAESK